MKLAALGLVTAVIGVVLGVPGLAWVGVLWVALGFPVRWHGRRIQALRDAAPDGKPALDGRTFAIGTALFLAIGVPSLVVGVAGLGFDDDHEAWRWLPIAVGALAVGFGVLGGLLYLAARAALAVSDGGSGTPAVPATIWVRAMAETGTTVNDRPRLLLELTVEPDAGTGVAPWDVSKKATVPFTALGSLRVGSGFRALVHGPEHPASMEIGWDEPVSPPADPPAMPHP